MNSTPDPELLEAHDLALAALKEITDEKTIGEPAGFRPEPDGAVSLRFANRMAGYPGWFWTVTLARVEGAAPTVLEVELLPGDGALLAPEWTPWAERLAEYHAHQAELDQEAALAAEASGDDSDDSDEDEEDDDDSDDDDIDDLDASDFDEDGSPILHSGDVDGVDIDNFSGDDADDDDDSDDDDDDESDDDDDESEDESDDEDSDKESDDDDDDESDDDDSDDDEEADFDDALLSGEDELGSDEFQDPRVDRSY